MGLKAINFNVPVRYEVRPPCLSLNRLREIVDDYCDWGSNNQTAYVLAGSTNLVVMRSNAGSHNCLDWIKSVFKIASYITGFIPALMYLTKYFLRSSSFYIISTDSSEQNQAAKCIQRAFSHYKMKQSVKMEQAVKIIQTAFRYYLAQEVVKNRSIQNITITQSQSQTVQQQQQTSGSPVVATSSSTSQSQTAQQQQQTSGSPVVAASSSTSQSQTAQQQQQTSGSPVVAASSSIQAKLLRKYPPASGESLFAAYRHYLAQEAAKNRNIQNSTTTQSQSQTAQQQLKTSGSPVVATSSSTQAKLLRRYPPASSIDTLCSGKYKNESTESLFSDDEIVQVHEVIKCKRKKKDIVYKSQNVNTGERSEDRVTQVLEIQFTQNDKAIIQQQALRGCTAAVTAMLIYDKNENITIGDLHVRNLGNTGIMEYDIEKAGLKAKITQNVLSLKELAEHIEKQGSAIIHIGGELGGHVIVVDDVNLAEDHVRIRDPYHGWEITVTRQALLKRWHGGEIIQIA